LLQPRGCTVALRHQHHLRKVASADSHVVKALYAQRRCLQRCGVRSVVTQLLHVSP
jgi:hypothetical protein